MNASSARIQGENADNKSGATRGGGKNLRARKLRENREMDYTFVVSPFLFACFLEFVVFEHDIGETDFKIVVHVKLDTAERIKNRSSTRIATSGRRSLHRRVSAYHCTSRVLSLLCSHDVVE